MPGEGSPRVSLEAQRASWGLKGGGLGMPAKPTSLLIALVEKGTRPRREANY